MPLREGRGLVGQVVRNALEIYFVKVRRVRCVSDESQVSLPLTLWQLTRTPGSLEEAFQEGCYEALRDFSPLFRLQESSFCHRSCSEGARGPRPFKPGRANIEAIQTTLSLGQKQNSCARE
jgi:hypothetical protein